MFICSPTYQRKGELWSNKATEIQKRLKGSTFQVSNLLEQLAPDDDREQGRDLADYLIKPSMFQSQADGIAELGGDVMEIKNLFVEFQKYLYQSA